MVSKSKDGICLSSPCDPWTKFIDIWINSFPGSVNILFETAVHIPHNLYTTSPNILLKQNIWFPLVPVPFLPILVPVPFLPILVPVPFLPILVPVPFLLNPLLKFLSSLSLASVPLLFLILILAQVHLILLILASAPLFIILAQALTLAS